MTQIFGPASSRIYSAVFGALGASASIAEAAAQSVSGGPSTISGGRNARRSKYMPHQGLRECARRRRQMDGRA